MLDIAVDIRKGSPTFGQYFSLVLSGVNKKQLYIPKGFAHGFVVLTKEAVFAYKCDDYYNRESEGGILWNDKDLAIDWGIDSRKAIISEKDKMQPPFKQADFNFSYS